ncbi:MAG: threonine transporter RhtB [Caulobacter sp. 12-67-6]|nr:MAG: threonine transporter RhtB [Caulobacter sp. 12-67-6]OYX72525.1 MAG: threonine transporter RhtB [Caulobacter sp. 32-67-35]OYX93225.1 MAG: threonine transporter RhtB [Caulobacter sp. 35-67-4]
MSHAAWPVDPGMIAPFLVAVILIELTPGPNMAYLAALAAAHGRRAGLMAVAGVTCGLSVYMLAAVFGLTEVFRLYRPLYELLRWSGVAYLLWMAWDAWRSASEAETADALTPARWVLFRRGMVANLLNPKAALFYVTLLPGFIQNDYGSPTRQALILGSIHVLISIVIHGAIVLGADRAASLLDRARSQVWISRGLAISLAIVAVWMVWETRQRG